MSVINLNAQIKLASKLDIVKELAERESHDYQKLATLATIHAPVSVLQAGMSCVESSSKRLDKAITEAANMVKKNPALMKRLEWHHGLQLIKPTLIVMGVPVKI